MATLWTQYGLSKYMESVKVMAKLSMIIGISHYKALNVSKAFPRTKVSFTNISAVWFLRKSTIFLSENTGHPYVNIFVEEDGFVLKNTDYTNILHFIEQTHFSHF